METVLTAPSALLHNGEADVTDDYTLTYQWTDAQGSPVGTGATLQVTPTADTTYTCTVTAACTLDSTQVLTGQCVYTLRMHPGTTLGAVTGLAQGTRTLDQLENQSGTLSLIDQLVQGDSASESTPAVPGLRSVVFELDSATGTQVGTLSVQEGTYYYLEGTQGQPLLSQVTFTPRQAGTYGINFRAYGDAPLLRPPGDPGPGDRRAPPPRGTRSVTPPASLHWGRLLPQRRGRTR